MKSIHNDAQRKRTVVVQNSMSHSQGSGDADVPARTGAVTGAEGADSPQVGQIKDAEAPHECNGAARPQLLRPFGGGSGRSDSEEAQRIEGLFQSLVGAGANGT